MSGSHHGADWIEAGFHEKPRPIFVCRMDWLGRRWQLAEPFRAWPRRAAKLSANARKYLAGSLTCQICQCFPSTLSPQTYPRSLCPTNLVRVRSFIVTHSRRQVFANAIVAASRAAVEPLYVAVPFS
jgi:hypothetical protein